MASRRLASLHNEGSDADGMVEDASPHGQKSASVQAASVTLTKNLIGAGIFSLPKALHRGSVIPGLVVMALVGVLSGSTFVLIAFLCQKLDVKTYREIWSSAFGASTSKAVDTLIILNGFFCCVSYCILISDFLQKAFEGLFAWNIHRTVIIWVCTIGLLLPLSHARNLSALQKTSLMGLTIIAGVFLYVSFDCATSMEVATANLAEDFYRLDVGIFNTMAISTGAFNAHYNAPKLFAELNRSLQSHTHMVVISYGTSFLVYALFATAGLGLFGEQVYGNVLKNYPSVGNRAILMAWMGMAFAIMFTYPIVFSSARDSLIGAFSIFERASKTSPTFLHITVTTSMVTLISCVACAVEDVSLVTGLLGATVISLLCWVYPATIYLRFALFQHGVLPKNLQIQLLHGSSKRKHQAFPIKISYVLYAVFLVVVGALSMVISICNTCGLI